MEDNGKLIKEKLEELAANTASAVRDLLGQDAIFVQAARLRRDWVPTRTS